MLFNLKKNKKENCAHGFVEITEKANTKVVSQKGIEMTSK